MNGCKNCPAYDKCTVTYRSSACSALRYTYGLDSDPEIVTNADRIRAMSDEELVDVIRDKNYCPPEKNYITCGTMGTCQQCWLEWLQLPAKEGL